MEYSLTMIAVCFTAIALGVFIYIPRYILNCFQAERAKTRNTVISNLHFCVQLIQAGENKELSQALKAALFRLECMKSGTLTVPIPEDRAKTVMTLQNVVRLLNTDNPTMASFLQSFIPALTMI